MKTFYVKITFCLIVSLCVRTAHGEGLHDNDHKIINMHLSENKTESDNGMREIIGHRNQIGPAVFSVLENKVKPQAKIIDNGNIQQLVEALILLKGGGGEELKELILNYSGEPTMGITGAKFEICAHVANVPDPRCVDLRKQLYSPSFLVSVALSRRMEFLPFIESKLKDIDREIRERKGSAVTYEKARLIETGAIRWLKGEFPEIKETPGTSEWDRIKDLIYSFFNVFERYSPWLILPEEEKGTPIEEHNRVKYYPKKKRLIELENMIFSMDKGAKTYPPGFNRDEYKALSLENREIVSKISRENWEEEKLMPVRVDFGEMTYTDDKLGLLVDVYLKVYETDHSDKYRFYLEEELGHWEFRYAYKHAGLIS